MFILAAQCPAQATGWDQIDDSLSDPTDYIAIASEIAAALIEQFPIDPDHVLVAGVSSGGTACWEMLQRFPGRFAAAAPLAGAVPSRIDGTQLTKIPIWAFHNSNDDTISSRPVQKMIDDLRRQGSNAWLTLTVGDPELGRQFGDERLGYHNCWTTAFQDYALTYWLLDQNRSNPASPHPGVVSLRRRMQRLQDLHPTLSWPEVWPRALTIATACTLVFLVRREIRILIPNH
jgi:predicted peptidase